MGTLVHRTLPVLKSLSEFIGGSRAACGPDAELEALNELQITGSIEDVNHLIAIQKRDQVKGWFSPTGGEPLSSIYNDLSTYEHVHFVRYMPYSDALNTSLFHSNLQDFAGVYPIVAQFLNAQALTGNEQGVFSHFVAIVGIDSNLGYFVLNGDDIQALPISRGVTTYPGRWIGWQSILNAKPAGLIVFGRNTVNIPTGWHDDGTTLTAPNGVKVVHGFRDMILNHNPEWDSNLIPLDVEYATPTGTAQDFALRSIWTQSNNAISESGGQKVVETVKPNLTAEITELEDVVNKLKAV
jgi:hypothetical protein